MLLERILVKIYAMIGFTLRSLSPCW